MTEHEITIGTLLSHKDGRSFVFILSEDPFVCAFYDAKTNRMFRWSHHEANELDKLRKNAHAYGWKVVA